MDRRIKMISRGLILVFLLIAALPLCNGAALATEVDENQQNDDSGSGEAPAAPGSSLVFQNEDGQTVTYVHLGTFSPGYSAPTSLYNLVTYSQREF